MSRMVLWTTGGLVTAVCGLCAVLFLLLSTASGLEIVRQILERVGNENLGGRVQLTRLEGAPWKSFRIHGLSVTLPDSLGGMEVLGVEELRIDTGFWGYLVSGVPAFSITADGLRVAYIENVDGRGHNSIDALIGSGESDSADTTAFALPVSIPELNIARGRFLYFDPVDSTRLEATNIFLRGAVYRPGKIRAIIGTHTASFAVNGYKDAISSIFMDVRVDGDSVTIRDLTLEAMEAPPLSFHIQGTIPSIREKTVSLTLKATGRIGSITRIIGLETPLDGQFHLAGALSNTLTDPEVSLRLESPSLNTGIGDFRLAAIDLRYHRNTFLFDRFRGRHALGLISGQATLDLNDSIAKYQLTMDPSPLALEHLPSALFENGSPVAGEATISCDLSGAGFEMLPERMALHLSAPVLSVGGITLQVVNSHIRYNRGFIDGVFREATTSVRFKGRRLASGIMDMRLDGSIPDLTSFLTLFGAYPATGSAQINATITGPLSLPEVRFEGVIEHLTYGAASLGHLELNGVLNTGRLLRLGARLDSVKAVFSGEAELTGDQKLSGTLTTEFLRFSDYIRTNGGSGVNALMKIDGVLEGSLPHPLFRGQGMVKDLTVRNEHLGDADIQITYKDEAIRYLIEKPDQSVSARGRVQMAEGYPYDLRAEIRHANLSPLLSILAKRPIEQRTGRFSGRIEASGPAAAPDLSTINVALDSLIMMMDEREIHIPSPSTIKLDRQIITVDRLEMVGDFGHVLINGIASLVPQGLINLDALLEDVQLEFISPFILSQGNLIGSVDGLFSLTGAPDSPILEGNLSTSNIHYTSDSQTTPLGTVAASIRYENGQLQIPDISMNTPIGTSSAILTYPMNLSWAGRDSTQEDTRYEATVHMENLAVAPLREIFPGIPDDLDGRLLGRIDIAGSTSHIQDLDGVVAIDSLLLFGLQYELVNTDSIRIQFNAGYADVDRVDLEIRPRRNASSGQGRLALAGRLGYGTREGQPVLSDFNATIEDVSMGAALSLAAIDEPLTGLLDGTLSITGPSSEPSIRTSFSVDSVRYNEAIIDSVAGQAVYEKGNLFIHSLQTWLKGNTLVAQGTIPFGEPSGNEASETDDNAVLTIAGQNIDLNVFSGLFYDLENVEGRADIQLSVEGNPNAPRSTGSIRIHDAAIKIRDIEPELKTSEMYFQMEGNQLSLQPVEFKAGKGKILLSGRLGFDRMRLSSFDAKATMVRASLDLVGSARLIVNGALAISGTPDRSEVSHGDAPVVISGTVIQPLNIGTLVLGTGAVLRPPTIPDPFLENMNLDVEIDIPDLQIRNDLADFNLEGGLAISGTAQNPLITGNGTAKENGTIVYLDTKFELESGRLEITRRSPLESFTALLDDPTFQLDPEITLQARATRVRDIYGAEYDVTLSFNGRPSDPNLQLVATPIDEAGSENSFATLVGPEVISLLTFGLPGITTTGATDAVTGLGNRAIMMATGNTAEKLFRLDEVRIEGDLFRNSSSNSPAQFTISKRINRRAQVTFTRLFDSSEYKLRVGYQLTNYLFIETFTDQISERPQNGFDLKLKFRFR